MKEPLLHAPNVPFGFMDSDRQEVDCSDGPLLKFKVVVVVLVIDHYPGC